MMKFKTSLDCWTSEFHGIQLQLVKEVVRVEQGVVKVGKW